MQKTIYEDYKYSMQDTSRIYVGAKYTFAELIEEENLLFKFRMIIQRYVLPTADPEDTLESYLYYLEEGDLNIKLFRQMKAKIKVNVIEEKKNLFGKRRKKYVTKLMTIEQLVSFSPEAKGKMGLVIQELSVSKLAMVSL